jgi:hypothetical protein
MPPPASRLLKRAADFFKRLITKDKWQEHSPQWRLRSQIRALERSALDQFDGRCQVCVTPVVTHVNVNCLDRISPSFWLAGLPVATSVAPSGPVVFDTVSQAISLLPCQVKLPVPKLEVVSVVVCGVVAPLPLCHAIEPGGTCNMSPSGSTRSILYARWIVWWLANG